MAFVKSYTSFILVIVAVLSSRSIDETAAKPAAATASDGFLKFPCDMMPQSGTAIEVDEAHIWSGLKTTIVHEINHDVDQMTQQDILQCDTSPHIPIDTLQKLRDFSQIKSLREA
ncbi:unnamed protein product [Meganyctiphanes norvegica]|uniref:Uncharacterized protein n=1 Tax=Meganyctiphanes norvegica TaxID=48144 RepID=A0AAV2SPB0_MEGNR